MTQRDLYAGLIRLHILHHAEKETIYGSEISEELAHHGYDISPGTLYPMLHAMESKGYLQSTIEQNGSRKIRFYTITDEGRQALKDAKVKVKELFGELFEDDTN